MEFKQASPLRARPAERAGWVILSVLGVALAGATWAGVRYNSAPQTARSFAGSMPRLADAVSVAERQPRAAVASHLAVPSVPASASLEAAQREQPREPEVPIETITNSEVSKGEAIGGALPEAARQDRRMEPSREGGFRPSALGGSAAMSGKLGADAAKANEPHGAGGIFPPRAHSSDSKASSTHAAARRPAMGSLILHGSAQKFSSETFGRTAAGPSGGGTTTGSSTSPINPARANSEGCGVGCENGGTRSVVEMSHPPRVPAGRPVEPSSAAGNAGPGAPACGAEKAACSANGSGTPCCQGLVCSVDKTITGRAEDGGFLNQSYSCVKSGTPPGGTQNSSDTGKAGNHN